MSYHQVSQNFSGLLSLRVPMLAGLLGVVVGGGYLTATLDEGQIGLGQSEAPLVSMVVCAVLALMSLSVVFSERVRELVVARRDWYHPRPFWTLGVVASAYVLIGVLILIG